MELIQICTCTLHVGYAKSATVGDVTWKEQFYESMTDEGGPTCLSAAALSCSQEGEMLVVSTIVFRVSVWVLLAKPLFTWGSLYEAPTFGVSSLSFSKGASFGLYLPPAAWSSGKKLCFHVYRGDLNMLQDMMEEVHRWFQLPEHGVWPILDKLVVFPVC